MQSETLAPGLRRVTAPNPSPMTFTGTQTYVVGTGDVAVIDPGPAHSGHLSAILDALTPSERITHILVTHSHLDHSPLARPLSQATGAPIYAAGPSEFGRTAMMQSLAVQGLVGGGEGVDAEFAPDERIAEGDVLNGSWGELSVLETPGHMANHLSFSWNDSLFSGDLIMGWSTSLVSPPDGDMTAFLASVARLSTRSDRIFYPGHGDPVLEPQARAKELLSHRKNREAQILGALGSSGSATPTELTRLIYTDIAEALLPMAERNVLAHLIDLHGKSRITSEGPLSHTAKFQLV